MPDKLVSWAVSGVFPGQYRGYFLGSIGGISWAVSGVHPIDRPIDPPIARRRATVGKAYREGNPTLRLRGGNSSPYPRLAW